MTKSVNKKWIIVTHKKGIVTILIVWKNNKRKSSGKMRESNVVTRKPYYVSFSMYNENGEPLLERDFEG
jgi:hypothetical protein